MITTKEQNKLKMLQDYVRKEDEEEKNSVYSGLIR
jgi:hypothetical protein